MQQPNCWSLQSSLIPWMWQPSEMRVAVLRDALLIRVGEAGVAVRIALQISAVEAGRAIMTALGRTYAMEAGGSEAAQLRSDGSVE